MKVKSTIVLVSLLFPLTVWGQDSLKNHIEKKTDVQQSSNNTPLPPAGIRLQNRNFWNYLGFGGGVYYSEVPIPIQQIRYEDDKASGFITQSHNGTFIIDYSKGISSKDFYGTTGPFKPQAGKKYVEPFISPYIVYSIYTDPFTGEKLISIRPEVGFQNIKTKLFWDTHKKFPVPLDTAIQSTADKASQVTNIVDNNASAIVVVDTGLPNDTTQQYALDWNKYLFVPDGGKIPNFGQVMESEWFFSGPLSLLVKYRPGIAAKGKLPALSSTSTAGASFAIVTGSKHTLDFDKAKRGHLYKTPFSYAFPLFMLGATSTPVTIANDSTGRAATKYISDGNGVAFNAGTGIGIQVSAFAINFFAGEDFLIGSDARHWPYEKKIWYGGAIGVSLDKLLGISSGGN